MRLTRHGLADPPTPTITASLAARFASHHLIALPGFFGDDLWEVLDRRLPSARFRARVEHGVEIELTLDEPGLFGLFLLTLNDPALFQAIEAITDCGPIGCFTGRVYRRHNSDGRAHHYPWHNDVSDDRLVGLSINLGREPFEGGVLQIRDAETRQPISEMANTVPGDAMVFRISEAIEHQVTPVTGAAFRTVLAGWFCRTPRFADNFPPPLFRA